MTAERESAPLPTGLRERVLAASRVVRAAGRSFPDVGDISPTDAFGRAVDAFNELLCALAEPDWLQPVVNQFDVQGLVGHLLGVERDLRRCMMGYPDVAEADHVASTRDAAARQAGRPALRTRTDWRRATDRTRALVGSANLDQPVAMHGVRTSLATLLIVRAFELWTHENDIRRAVGRAPSVPDGGTLRLMTTAAAGALPVGAARIGLQEPTQVRLVLTGVGGGTWDVALGAPMERSMDIRIVTDAVAFCRLAANRVAVEELDLAISGDRARADRVLAAVSALALD